MDRKGQLSVDQHLAAYEQLLRRMHDSRVVEAGGPVEQWNQMVHELQEHHLALRATPEGRAGITRLVHHEVSTVRHWAATHALFWMSRSHVPSWNAKPAASQAPLSSKP